MAEHPNRMSRAQYSNFWADFNVLTAQYPPDLVDFFIRESFRQKIYNQHFQNLRSNERYQLCVNCFYILSRSDPNLEGTFCYKCSQFFCDECLPHDKGVAATDNCDYCRGVRENALTEKYID